jgi:hypothetical protein
LVLRPDHARQPRRWEGTANDADFLLVAAVVVAVVGLAAGVLWPFSRADSEQSRRTESSVLGI